MVTSGETGQVTESNDPVELIPAQGGNTLHEVVLINESGVAGFFSINGGASWARWPEGVTAIGPLHETIDNKAILFKRVTDGTDATGLYAWATHK